jgi:Na+-driven multidrug efflux pump
VTICGGKRALCSFGTISRSFNELVKIANPDKETKRLLGLGIPLTLAAAVESLCEAIAVALISRYLGVNALTAYVVTNLLVGLSDVFINGVSDALNTVCSHAVGAENYFLAGQYVQIAMIFYIVFAIPIMGVWWFIMEDCLRLFGLNEEVVRIGVQYTKVMIFDYIQAGLFDSYTALLDISGYAVPATIFDIIAGAADLVVVWSLLAFASDMSLFWVGVSHLVSGLICFVVFTLIAVGRGWLDPFWDGLVKTLALKVSKSFCCCCGISSICANQSRHLHRMFLLSNTYWQQRSLSPSGLC